MKINLVFLIVIFIFASCNNKASKDKNEIKIILHPRTFKTDTIRFSNGIYTYDVEGLFYNISGNFFKKNLSSNNLDKIDTIIIKTNKDIIFYHSFIVEKYLLLNLTPGSLVNVYYPNDLPKININNKTTKFIDEIIRFETKNYPKIENDIVFFIEKNKPKNQEELNIDKNNRQKYYLLKNKFIDSLYSKKIIDLNNYNIYKKEMLYLLSTNTLTYYSEIDLTLPASRKLILNNFENTFKPIIIKSVNGNYHDTRIQFDKILKIKNIPKENKDYLLFYYLEDINNNFSLKDTKKYLTLFEQNVTNKDLIKEIKSKIHDFDNLNPSSVFVFDSNKNKHNLFDLINNKYKNKIVYIDFWASWCAPCRLLTPHSKILRKEYDNKNIAFVYVSIDKDFEKWQNAMLKDNISKKESFFAINYPYAAFYKDMNLNSIPRFMIFKNGKLVNKNAPAPDSDEIRIELNKYLKID